MTKYISDIKTVEDVGYTGIRIEVSEKMGDTVVRAVNEEKFKEIEDTLEECVKLSDLPGEIDEEVNKLSINAATLNGYTSDNFPRELLVGRIKKSTSTDDWDYTEGISGVYGSQLKFEDETIGHGFVLILRPGNYNSNDVTNGYVTVQFTTFVDGGIYKMSYQSKSGTQLSEQNVKFDGRTGSDGTSPTIDETCLVCPVTLHQDSGSDWLPSKFDDGLITFNFKGNSITRTFKGTHTNE
jgi:hypothetical protein